MIVRDLGRLVERAADAVFSGACPGCGREGEAICVTCRPGLDARLDLPPGVPIGLPAELPAPLVQLDWCAPYTGVARRALLRLKYAGERRLARPLGEAVARRWTRVAAGGEILVPVPVHAERRRQRGYDQAALIAEAAGAALRLPVVPILERHRHTAAQFDLDLGMRAANVAGAFTVRQAPRGPRGRAGDPLRGRWIVLVDDVVTTGATLAACAQSLIDGGAAAVSAIAVARER